MSDNGKTDLWDRLGRTDPKHTKGFKRAGGVSSRPLAGKTLALVFEKPSTRTRVSFEVGMRELGGQTIMLGRSDTQLGRGETIADTARVLSRYVDIIMMRTTVEEKLLEMAKYATVPVINGLTDKTHPCQLMADVMTYEEHRGSIRGKSVAWSGDGNNMATSWIHAAVQFDFELKIACPAVYHADLHDLARAESLRGKVSMTTDPQAAVRGADVVVADALDYAPEGTAIRIDVTRTNDEVSISVTDNGSGMSTESRERAFDRFWRGTESQNRPGGSGLGLSIVAQLAAASGGRVALRENPEGGLVAVVVLRASQLRRHDDNSSL